MNRETDKDLEQKSKADLQDAELDEVSGGAQKNQMEKNIDPEIVIGSRGGGGYSR
jgi:hypothetical protein